MRSLLAVEVTVGKVILNFFIALPLMIVVAFVAGRLLGVKRSWTTAVASGIIGWGAGVTLSLVITRTEGNAGFGRNVWLFSAFFAMSAIAWIELLAKPGSLARAQTGLGSIPRPMRALRRKRERIARYVQITRIGAKYGLGRSLGLAGTDEEASTARPPMARRLRAAMEECGGIFVKLGQVLSTRSDLLPPAAVAEFAQLQDNVAPADPESVKALLTEDLGQEVDAVFAEFDWEPIAAASIGQVYRARLTTGERVIVQGTATGHRRPRGPRPGGARPAGHGVEQRTPWGAEYHVVDVADEFAARLREELDFRIEAANASDISAHLDDDGGVRIPQVHDQLTSSRVLVMERFDGASVRESGRIDDLGFDRATLADRLLRSALQQMLIDGHFHADPHPGNVMVLTDGDIGLIDFGAAGRLDAMQQSSLRAMILAINRRDATLLCQGVLEVANVRRGFDDEQLQRALARFMARHLGSGSVPSAAMFNEMLELFFSFGISLPPEFSTFFRALVTLEGTLTTLCPGYSVIDQAQAIAAEWTHDLLTPGNLRELATQELIGMAPLLRRPPRHVDRLATIAERDGLKARVSLFTDPDDLRALTLLLNRAVLAFLGGVVGVISVVLVGIQGGPSFTGETSLYEFFGYFGLFCSTVLVLRVLVAVMRDGLN